MACSLWTWVCNQFKPTTTIKKTRHLNELYTWARNVVRWQWSVGAFFDSCQLTITFMSIRISTIKLNTDCICFGHLATNCQSVQENSQSERAYYCSHIIINNDCSLSLAQGWKKRFTHLVNQLYCMLMLKTTLMWILMLSSLR